MAISWHSALWALLKDGSINKMEHLIAMHDVKSISISRDYYEETKNSKSFYHTKIEISDGRNLPTMVELYSDEVVDIKGITDD